MMFIKYLIIFNWHTMTVSIVHKHVEAWNGLYFWFLNFVFVEKFSLPCYFYIGTSWFHIIFSRFQYEIYYEAFISLSIYIYTYPYHATHVHIYDTYMWHISICICVSYMHIIYIIYDTNVRMYWESNVTFGIPKFSLISKCIILSMRYIGLSRIF